MSSTQCDTAQLNGEAFKHCVVAMVLLHLVAADAVGLERLCQWRCQFSGFVQHIQAAMVGCALKTSLMLDVQCRAGVLHSIAQCTGLQRVPLQVAAVVE